jgi:S-adenosylmethionine synthetase
MSYVISPCVVCHMSQQQVAAESASMHTKSSALSMPFSLSYEVLEKLEEFKTGTCNWVEMTVVSEVGVMYRNNRHNCYTIILHIHTNDAYLPGRWWSWCAAGA